MRVPSFRYYDGRAKERIKIVDYFPSQGKIYLEPFAGAGNVFFEVRQRRLRYDEWWLNDISSFLSDVTDCRLNAFPSVVERETFDWWKDQNTPESRVLERAISYGGRGYFSGFIGSNSYNRDSILESCWLARSALYGTVITHYDWETISWNNFDSSDFVYFDPPTYATSTKAYPPISHQRLLDLLNTAKFKWCLTGVPNYLYTQDLKFKTNEIISRDLEIWLNFSLTG
jgi:site-specific DNA-adenine methylase